MSDRLYRNLLGYIFLAGTFSCYYFIGLDSNLGRFLNEVALGIFSYSIYLDFFKRKK